MSFGWFRQGRPPDRLTTASLRNCRREAAVLLVDACRSVGFEVGRARVTTSAVTGGTFGFDRASKRLERLRAGGDGALPEALFRPQTTSVQDALVVGVELEDGCGQADVSQITVSLSAAERVVMRSDWF